MMYKYFLKRIILLIPVLLGLTFVIFALIAIAPGNPGRAILGPSATEEAVKQFNENIGYYKPFLVRYGYFLLGVLKLDFGVSYASGASVMEEIINRFPTTLKIAAYSMVFAVCVGVPLGMLSAIKQYSIIDNIARVVSITLAAVPVFWLGLMMVYMFSLKLGWLPSYGVSTWKNFVMPIIALGIPYAARQLRMARSCMLETIRQDYVRTARAKGAPESIVIWRHALKNALLPIITMIGMHFGSLLGGAIVTETVFSMPGLGTYLVTAIRAKDIPAVMGTSIVLAVAFCIVMLFVDLLYAVIDPRIRSKYVG